MNSTEPIKDWKKQFLDQETIYKNILEGTMAGYWDWHIAKDYEYLSPTFKSMFGYDNETIYGDIQNGPENVILELKCNIGEVPMWMIDLISMFVRAPLTSTESRFTLL